MLIFVILIIIFTIFFFLYLSTEEKFAMYIASTTFLILLLFILASVILSIVLPFKYETKVISIKPIFSIENVKSINGTFVLGTGRINQSIVYYYYTQEKEGLKLEYIDSDDVYIVESDRKPVIETIEEKPIYIKPWIEEIVLLQPFHFPKTYCTIIVPKNTVKKVFDLQLKN